MNEKMATEEYLNKIPNSENNMQKIEKNEILEKKNLPFTKLGVYTHLLPITLELLEIIDKAEKSKHTKLWWMLYETSVNSLIELIVGYNKYHTKDKADVYKKVRANISRVQALIIILAHLKQLDKKAEEKYCAQLEECIRATSSLIRTIEGKGK